MEEKLKEIVERTFCKLESVVDNKELASLKVEILGKNGELTGILRNLKDLPADKRPMAGKLVNDARVRLEEAFDGKFKKLYEEELSKKLEEEKIDITIEGSDRKKGGLHPLTIVKNSVIDFFSSLGFMVVDSPEIETDYYNFKALNTPDNHPARDMQDTFYVTSNILLRTQTSAGQIRTMERIKPPIKMINIGRVFRADDVDATHYFIREKGLLLTII